MTNFGKRMIGAARLDPAVYEEVEADESALLQAGGVVVLSSLAAGIGSVTHAGGSIFLMSFMALLSWVVWAVLIWFIGAKLLPEPQTEADPGQLMRTLGFASTPGIIRVIGIIPFLSWLVTLIASIWMLASTVIAVRQALDYKSTVRAVVVCLIGWVVYWLVTIMLLRLIE